jgi:ribA/ribD-fused uncharacterized protein
MSTRKKKSGAAEAGGGEAGDAEDTCQHNAYIDKAVSTLKEELKGQIKTLKDTLTNQIDNLNKTLREHIDKAIDDKLEKIRQDAETAVSKVEEMKRVNEKLQHQFDNLKSTSDCLRNELHSQSERLIQLEAYGRRENLIFNGVSQDTDESCSNKIRNIITNKLRINADNIKFDRCHRLKGKKPQPIIVRFNWFEDRMRVFNAKAKLAGTAVSIQEDFPLEVTERRKALFPIMKLARSKGKFAVLRADKLVVDNTVYTTDALHKLPQDIDPAATATKKHGNVLAFFGGHSPLSNFHTCEVTVQNKVYSSVEQYFQHAKCVFANDMNTARKILQNDSPLLCKRLGDNVNVDLNAWLPMAKQAMYEGMKAKFTQNEIAKNFLLNTGDCLLAEASYNKTWGTGLSLFDQNNGDRGKWLGRNVTGEVLMNVRQNMT